MLPGAGTPPSVFDAVQRKVVSPPISTNTATLYVCGITPYDATHLGHAFTYLAFDTLQRAWLDAGIRTRYVQNITDVDDPLLERAAQTHVDWRELADKLTAKGVKFVIEPKIRFAGEVGEQATMFFLDPSGNALEFKGFNDFSQVFAK